MKIIILIACLLTASLNSISQTCEARESKLLETVGGMSAGFVYNTYAFIGSVADACSKQQDYGKDLAASIMKEQKAMIENLLKMTSELLTQNMIKDKSDKDYVMALNTILKGLKQQAQLLLDYLSEVNDQNIRKFDEQRQENWKNISKLMGLDNQPSNN